MELLWALVPGSCARSQPWSPLFLHLVQVTLGGKTSPLVEKQHCSENWWNHPHPGISPYISTLTKDSAKGYRKSKDHIPLELP